MTRGLPLRRAGLLLIVLVASTCSVGRPPDDVFGLEGLSFGSSTHVERGVVFTDGFTVLRNLSKHPVRLRALVFEDGAPGLELVGVRVAGLERAIGGHAQLPGFPPQDRPPGVELGALTDLAGFVIPTGGEYATKGVELLIGVRRTSPGRATRRALLLTYETDGHRVTARLPSALAVCAPSPVQCEMQDAG